MRDLRDIPLMDISKSKDAGNKMLAAMIEDPRQATDTFRRVFELQKSQQTPLAYYSSPDIGEDDLLVSLTLWANCMLHMFSILNEPDTASVFVPRHIEAFAEVGGLLDLYQDMVMWPGIFSEDQVCSESLYVSLRLKCLHLQGIYDHIVAGLATGIDAMRQRTSLPRLEARVSELWDHAWCFKDEHAQQLRCGDFVDGGAPVMSSIVVLLRAYQEYYKSMSVLLCFLYHQD